jgi:hypothetical protein
MFDIVETGTVVVSGPVREPAMLGLEFACPTLWAAALLSVDCPPPPPQAASRQEKIAIEIRRSARGCCAVFMSISHK